MMLVKLWIRDPDGVERILAVELVRAYVIGRGSQADVHVPDSRVSRRHAVLELDPEGSPAIRDIGSRHGITLDGFRVSQLEPTVLNAGSSLRLGDTRIRVLAIDDTDGRYRALSTDGTPLIL